MIRLGYQLGSGKPVDVPADRHIAISGQTQRSGKTTTLEALVRRSGKRAVAFVTKRAESGFRSAHEIPPYFEDSADWEFVSSILEAMLGEKLKLHRSKIMDACRNADSLADVYTYVHEHLRGVRTVTTRSGRVRPGAKEKWTIKPATGFVASILTELEAYLDKVIPQISRLPYTATLNLAPGLNVMNLAEYSTEMQGLVIRSVLRWVYLHERDTVVIIPEAWEFIPQNRRSPVLLAAEELIRKGGAAGNFVWLDSQDIAAVHKNVLRSVGVWILGVQREQNEVARTLTYLSVAPQGQKALVQELMQLGRGQFFAAWEREVAKVYVQPFWISDAHAAAIARGDESVESAEKIWREEHKRARAGKEDRHAETRHAPDVEPSATRRDPQNGSEQGPHADAAPRPSAGNGGVVGPESVSRTGPDICAAAVPVAARDGASCPWCEAGDKPIESSVAPGRMIHPFTPIGRVVCGQYPSSAISLRAESATADTEAVEWCAGRSRDDQGTVKTRLHESEPPPTNSTSSATAADQRSNLAKEPSAQPDGAEHASSVSNKCVKSNLTPEADASAPPASSECASAIEGQTMSDRNPETGNTYQADMITWQTVAEQELAENARLIEIIRQHGIVVPEFASASKASPARPAKPAAVGVAYPSNGNFAGFVRQLRQHPEVIALLRQEPEIRVTIDRPVSEFDGNSLKGRMARLITEKFFEKPKAHGEILTECKRRQWVEQKSKGGAIIYNPLEELARMGFLTVEADGYQSVAGMKITVVQR